MKNKIIFKPYQLIYPVAILLIIIFSIFVRINTFPSNESYVAIIRSMSIVVSILLFLIIIAETISLTFDRTATKNTLYLSIFLFFFYAFSRDFIFVLNTFGIINDGTYNIIFKYVAPIINDLCLLGFFYFTLMFYKNDYFVNTNQKNTLLILLTIALVNIILVILQIDIAHLVFKCAVTILLLAFFVNCLIKTRKMDNFITSSIVFFIGVSVLLAYLYGGLFNYGFFGISTMLFIVVVSGYINIYSYFLYNKTMQVYSYEDNKKKEITTLEEIMDVSCFHCFDCKFKGENVIFPSKKAKELFALLVILKGKILSMDKAITYLWPDKDIEKSKILYRDAIWKLRKTFQDINFKGVIFKRGMTILNVKNIKCDYYDALNKKLDYNEQPLLPEYDWSIEFENNFE